MVRTGRNNYRRPPLGLNYSGEPTQTTSPGFIAGPVPAALLSRVRRHVRQIVLSPKSSLISIDELSRREGKHVAPPTVYRTLDFLLERGFVHKIESLNAYAPCEHLGHAHHGMLLICEACGRSEEIEDDEVIRVLAAKAAGSGFRLRRVMVEAKGLCRRCGGKLARPAA